MEKSFKIYYDEKRRSMDIDYIHPHLRCPRHYCLDVPRMTTSAAVLDMIVQVAKKPWASDELVGVLVKEINKLLALQANYCSMGSDL